MATTVAPSVEDIRRLSQERGVEFYFAQFVDMYARPSAKLVPAVHLDDLVTDGAGFAGFAAGEIGQVPSDPDIAAVPDLRSDGNGGIKIADELDDLEKPCYDLKGLTRNYEFLRTVSNYVNGLGWGNYANDHEDAHGQFEQNFTYTDALTSCDRAIFFRYMVHTLAQQQGLLATFMPKPFTNLTGNGCHFHLSLWDGDTNLFLDEDDARGLGLSETAYHFIGGLKKHAKAYSAVTAPTVNSYKRLKLGSTSSGATWSPVWISYGYNNRTQMLRIPAPGRVEDRTVDGSTNPYLAATVILAAGIDGIENKLDPGEPNSDNLYSIPHDELRARGLETLPSNLLQATMELERDDVMREALGEARNEDYVDYFIRVKQEEWNRYHEQVTPWEIKEYLTRF